MKLGYTYTIEDENNKIIYFIYRFWGMLVHAYAIQIGWRGRSQDITYFCEMKFVF